MNRKRARWLGLVAAPLALGAGLWPVARERQKRADAQIATQKLTEVLQHIAPSLSEVDFLLAKGADVNARRPDGTTMLHMAVLGYPDVVESLLRHRANVEARDADGNTPLVSAVRSLNVNTASVLLRAGANPSVPLFIERHHCADAPSHYFRSECWNGVNERFTRMTPLQYIHVEMARDPTRHRSTLKTLGRVLRQAGAK